MIQQSYVHIRLRRDTASNWTLNNPVLRVGEPGIETDTRKLKFGDGITNWRNLPYAGIDISDSLLLENIDDRVSALIKGGSNIIISYNDAANELTISAVGLQLAGDYATLVNGKVPASQLPSYVDDVLEFASLSSFPAIGENDKIYVTLDSNKTYRWSGSAYVEISASPGSTDAVPEGSVNKYYTDARASAAAPVQSVSGKTGTVTLTKSDVGLGNVDNTSDVNKPVSTAQAAADSAVQNAAAADATTKANNAQAFAIQRSNHTGTQAISTINGLQTALNLKDWTVPTLSPDSTLQAEAKSQYYLPPTTGAQPVGGPTPITVQDPLVGNVGDYYLIWNASKAPIVIGGVSISPTEGSNDNIYSRVFVKGSTGLSLPGVVAQDRWETRNHNSLGRRIQKITLGFSVPSPITAEINTEYVFSRNSLVGPYTVGNCVINDPASASVGDAYVVYKPSGTMHNVVVGGVTYSTSSTFYIYRSYTYVGTTASWQTTSYIPVQSVAGKTGDVSLNKADVGLDNVDNTSDLAKPISTAMQTALDGKASTTHTHDDRYYTETEIDSLLAGVGGGELTSPGAKNIYVDNGRTDSYTEDGSQYRPFKTMRAALASVPSAANRAEFNDKTKRFYCFRVAPGFYDEEAGGTLNIPYRPSVVFDLSGGATLKGNYQITRPSDMISAAGDTLMNAVFAFIGSNNRPAFNNGVHSYVGILGNLTIGQSGATTNEAGAGGTQIHLTRCGVRGVIEFTGPRADPNQLFCWNNSGFDTLKAIETATVTFYGSDTNNSQSGNALGNMIGNIDIVSLEGCFWHFWASVFNTRSTTVSSGNSAWMPAYNEIKANSFTRANNVATVTLQQNHGQGRDLLPDGYWREQYILINGVSEDTSFNTPNYGAKVVGYPSANTVSYENAGPDVTSAVTASAAKWIKGTFFGNGSGGTIQPGPWFLLANEAAVHTHSGWRANSQPGTGSAFIGGRGSTLSFRYPALGWAQYGLYVRHRLLLPGNGYQYRNVSSLGVGRAGATQPTWPTTIGATVVDGTVTWQCEPLGFTLGTGVNVTASITSGSNQVTLANGAVQAANFQVGQTITGTGIPASATITAVNGAVLTISGNATATNAAATLSITGDTAAVGYNVQQTLELLHNSKNIYHNQIDSGIAGATTVQQAFKSVKTLLDGKATIVAAPASATATGTAGNIAYDNNYIYVCVAANTWVRAPLSTW